MTPSIEERREVALSLRYLANVELRGSDDVVGFIEALDNEFFDSGPNPMSDFALRLADLIEPLPERTCRNTYKERGVTGFPIIGPFTCSSCGEHTETMCSIGYGDKMIEVPKFCPHCGARVVES